MPAFGHSMPKAIECFLFLLFNKRSTWMTIVINSTHFIQFAGNHSLYDYFLQIAASRPEHQFIFITPSATNVQTIASKNSTHIISSPKANNTLMWKIWLNYKLPSIGKKYNADLLVNTGGVCSLRTTIPQWLFVSDLSFLNFPGFFSKKQRYFFKKNMPAFLKKAKYIGTASEFLKNEILQYYPGCADNVHILKIPINALYRPLGWKEKELVKEKYTGGKEYFLFSGQIHLRNNLVNLLKAFSIFKKRQKTNMWLIITSKAVTPNDSFLEIFKTYRYRAEVSLLLDLPEKDLSGITAAAYAFLYPSSYDGMARFPLQAMQCEVPVITTDTGALKEIIGDAALYTNGSAFEDIADKMMQVFKDESLRALLINRGKEVIDKRRKDTMNEFFGAAF
ncbi:MAG: glycosyltransferase family 1 protein [Ferruginibacter sp.]